MAALPSKARRVAQPSSFGDPRPVKNRRFYRIARQMLAIANKGLYAAVAASCVSALGLLVYVGVVVEYEQIFVSDGTVFSCQIDTVKVKGRR